MTYLLLSIILIQSITITLIILKRITVINIGFSDNFRECVNCGGIVTDVNYEVGESLGEYWCNTCIEKELEKEME